MQLISDSWSALHHALRFLHIGETKHRQVAVFQSTSALLSVTTLSFFFACHYNSTPHSYSDLYILGLDCHS